MVTKLFQAVNQRNCPLPNLIRWLKTDLTSLLTNGQH